MGLPHAKALRHPACPSQRNPATILSDAIRIGAGNNRMVRFAANRIRDTGEKLWAGTATTHDLSCLSNAVTSLSNLSAAERGGLDKTRIVDILTRIGKEVAPLGERHAQAIFAVAREAAAQARPEKTAPSME